MSVLDYLKMVLKNEYGILSERELDAAIKKMRKIDTSVFVAKPTKYKTNEQYKVAD